MDPCTDASDTSSELPSSPSNGSSDGGTDDPPIQAAAEAAAAGEHPTPPPQHQQQQRRNRYDEQKKRDWSTFQRFLENRKPRLTLSRVRSPHVIEFLKSIDNFGKTLVHEPSCPFFGRSDPPTPCSCPLRQSWGSLDSLVGRLRAACEDSPTRPETNPFGVRAVRNYLLQVKDSQATARGIPYSKRRKNRVPAIDGASTPAVEGSNAPPGGSDALVTLSTSVAGEESSALPDVSAAADASNYVEQEASVVLRGCSAADTTAGTSVVREGSSAPPGAVPLLGSFGQDGQTQLQICWVRPPVLDNQSAPPFLPIWRCPNVQSLVPFLPPFPYIPVPTAQRAMENELRVPKQESQSEEEDHVMEPSGTREGPSSSDEASAGDPTQVVVEHPAPLSQRKNRYEEQKRRDWNTFLRFLENRQPRLTLSRVRSPHVIEFLKSMDQFGKTLVHEPGCSYFGISNPDAPCACPLRQSWGSLDSLVGRLRAACEESPNRPESNPFGVRAVRNYLLQVKDSQATARGIPYSKKRKRSSLAAATVPFLALPDGGEAGGDEVSSVGAASAAATDTSAAGEGPDAPEGASSNYGGKESATTTAAAVSSSASVFGEDGAVVASATTPVLGEGSPAPLSSYSPIYLL